MGPAKGKDPDFQEEETRLNGRPQRGGGTRGLQRAGGVLTGRQAKPSGVAGGARGQNAGSTVTEGERHTQSEFWDAECSRERKGSLGLPP